ncbi:redoxin domain-containing protein [Acidicapsa dinghuensis]|uniref:Redoxin domain-containing protein n=1 Tax=Acidicapsa dinghuensis TaxID=2218256 RepID=A0ABW1EKI2_9BACT|nr:redoxin domain-containing protein [Acidicapsa dinghuensis]
MVHNSHLSTLSSWTAALLLSAAGLSLLASAQVKVGAPAPDFQATASNGKTESLDQFKGKYVVLEWHNQGCPYTRKHYTSGNMQALQKEWTAKGVVWFTVISSAPGEQGYVTASQENSYLNQMHADPTAALLDFQGKIGHLYSAKTTPQMIVIDPAGKVIYDGAIDNRPTSDVEDIKGAKNYVNEALTEAMAGKPVTTSYTRPYGCSVKYAD